MNRKLTNLARFAGLQFRVAFQHMSKHGFMTKALGMTAESWWSARYQSHVLQTDDPAFVETMAMNWFNGDHKASKAVGIVRNGSITVNGKTHNTLFMLSRTSDGSAKLTAYHPYYGGTDKEEPWLTPFIEFADDQDISPDKQKALQNMMILSALGR